MRGCSVGVGFLLFSILGLGGERSPIGSRAFV